ncbi:DUF4003 domain-containing protein [Clostridium senegalense]|uniref:DUF4003 family protein n=1 Tax=Clostridium senegalense TaxID=1465809 RepID=UPI001C112788|nr:DUF4003 family protein [Clostridium senegalense]MBU5227640.1 DUF4003 domain-containing protein [Clostridium senegalense]
MEQCLKNKILKMISNYEELGKTKRHNSNLIKACNALSLAIENRVIDAKSTNEAIKVINKNTSFFSVFKNDNVLLSLATTISLTHNPKLVFLEIKGVYEKLQKYFSSSEYLVMAANIIYKHGKKYGIYETVERTKISYELMRKNHKFLTSKEDYCAAAMIAMTCENLDETFNGIEKNYKYLSENGFNKSNELQTLTHMLSFANGTVEEKALKVVKLYKFLKENDFPLKGQLLPLVGIVTSIVNDNDKFLDDVKSVDDELEKNGFGNFVFGKDNRAVVSVALTLSSYTDSMKNKVVNGLIESIATNTITNVLIETQIINIAAISSLIYVSTKSN